MMKLSDAIEAGAKISPQAFGMTQCGNATCALGAALLGIGKLHDKAYYSEALDYFDVLFKEASHPLVNHGKATLILSIVRTLNDQHKWTRQRIAKWVRKHE